MALPKQPEKLPKKQEKRSVIPNLDADAARLTRYNLGAISVEDLMTFEDDPADAEGEEGRKAYVARIHSMLPFLKVEMKRAIALQLDFNSRWSENWMQVIFGRGGINSLTVIVERWEKLSLEHLENLQAEKEKNEDFNKNTPVAETE